MGRVGLDVEFYMMVSEYYYYSNSALPVVHIAVNLYQLKT